MLPFYTKILKFSDTGPLGSPGVMVCPKYFSGPALPQKETGCVPAISATSKY